MAQTGNIARGERGLNRCGTASAGLGSAWHERGMGANGARDNQQWNHGMETPKPFFMEFPTMRERYEVSVTGINDLIMHWDNILWADQMEAVRTQMKKDKVDKHLVRGGDDRCPPGSWKGYAYHDGVDLAMPIDNLRAIMLKAGAKIPLPGTSKETFKKLSQSGIHWVDSFATLYVNGSPIKHADIMAVEGTFAEQVDAVSHLGFELFAKRASVGTAKHLRVRPRFSNWGFSAQFEATDKALTQDVLAELWSIAGVYIGLCDWRPGSPKSPGPFGTFAAELKKVG